MNDRIRQVRVALNMTQTEFGRKLGVGRGVIVNAELNRARVRDLLVGHMCEVFGVNRRWLEEGVGEMFMDTDEATLERLSKKYGLTDDDRRVIIAYARSAPQERAALAAMLDRLAALPRS